MIELRNVDAGKAGRKLFKDFSWTIDDGEHWLITGRNGSGKTTLLELLAGNLHASNGIVHAHFISGTTWDERYADRKKKIHFIPAHAIQSLLKQNQELYYQQRYYGIGDERVPLVRDILGKGYRELEHLQLPASFSIESLLELEVTRLSNGQLKKLLLTKILLSGNPRMLLLDYPFEGLDIGSRQDLCDFIDFIASNLGVQIILADHHQQLPKVLNRKLVLENFKIVSDDKKAVEERTSAQATRHTVDENTNDSVVEIIDLRIQYGNTVILDHFNWKIRRGERWALIGRNGAGKTTLFSMIFADHPMAYSQNISLFGRRRGTGESIWDIKKRISYLGPELMSYLSPEQIVMNTGAYMRSVVKPWNEEVFNKLCEMLQMLPLMEKSIRILSSGELQMILVMISLMKDAEMLLLDEPFQFLDPIQKLNLTTYLRSHLKKDQTLILITHYEEDLREWTDLTKRL